MIRQDIRLERANGWRVTCFYAVTHYEVDEIMQRLVEAGAQRRSLDRAYENLSSANLNTGLCFSGSGQSVLVIGVASSGPQFANSAFHEVHHLASQIAKDLGWDLMGEEVCYLAGEIGQQIHPIIAHYLCEECRYGDCR
ncbi:hypothetical protein [uncultured Alistipes sp.]|uniref:hypothetical protein n=1 Tax=uncultured Alistipes sp. TaxID=538949 RepID=UPI00262DCE40|nr:hypothetical protein [uncultured Alistipes sp.]